MPSLARLEPPNHHIQATEKRPPPRSIPPRARRTSALGIAAKATETRPIGRLAPQSHDERGQKPAKYPPRLNPARTTFRPSVLSRGGAAPEAWQNRAPGRRTTGKSTQRAELVAPTQPNLHPAQLTCLKLSATRPGHKPLHINNLIALTRISLPASGRAQRRNTLHPVRPIADLLSWPSPPSPEHPSLEPDPLRCRHRPASSLGTPQMLAQPITPTIAA